MGTDFSLYSFRGAKSLTFPLTAERLPGEFAPVPWPQLKNYLFSIGARENGSRDCLWLDFGDDGSLEISAYQYPEGTISRQPGEERAPDSYDSIGIDVHAYWTHVYTIFRKALEFESDLVLFDPQEAIFHNAESFQPLAIEQYEWAYKEAMNYRDLKRQKFRR
jgi:hypothetical protein